MKMNAMVPQFFVALHLNNAGEFTLPATRVEAMYAPEVFGEAPNGKVLAGLKGCPGNSMDRLSTG